MKLLIIDDNEAVLRSLKLVFTGVFDHVVTAKNPQLLPAMLSAGDVDAVLLDMNFNTCRLDGSDGLFWLTRIKSSPSAPAVVLITAFGDVPLAVEAMKRGAEDFVTKPWDNDDLIDKLNRAMEKCRMKKAEQSAVSEANLYRERADERKNMTLEEIKTDHINNVVKECGGNLTLAASRLGINRQTLYNQMKKPPHTHTK